MPNWARRKCRSASRPQLGPATAGRPATRRPAPASTAIARSGRRKPRETPVIDAEPEWVKASKEADFKQGERVFHDKFGYGVVKSVDGDKLEVIFEHGGRKKVVGSFLDKA